MFLETRDRVSVSGKTDRASLFFFFGKKNAF